MAFPIVEDYKESQQAWSRFWMFFDTSTAIASSLWAVWPISICISWCHPPFVRFWQTVQVQRWLGAREVHSGAHYKTKETSNIFLLTISTICHQAALFCHTQYSSRVQRSSKHFTCVKYCNSAFKSKQLIPVRKLANKSKGEVIGTSEWDELSLHGIP